MKTVFLYAGQGSQHVGMGKDLSERFPTYRAVAEQVLPQEKIALMQEGDMEILSQTQNTQPCMAAFAAGVTAVLRENGIAPDAACGLSLGEYGALHAAGVMTAQDYVDTVTLRGEAMADAAAGKSCAMSAILGMKSSQVEEACDKVEGGFVKVVNYNCPGQYVICGDESAVQEAEAILKDMGMRRSIRLKVSGPFHTHYMEPAAQRLEDMLATIRLRNPQIPVVLNVTGDYYDGASDLKENLCRQIQEGVHFEESITRLIQDGADTFIEIGPGNTLSGFVKKCAKALQQEVTTFSIDTAEDLEHIIAMKEELIHGES